MTQSIPAELGVEIILQDWAVINRSDHCSHICHEGEKLFGVSVRIPRVLGELIPIERSHSNCRSSRQYIVDQRQGGTSVSSLFLIDMSKRIRLDRTPESIR